MKFKHIRFKSNKVSEKIKSGKYDIFICKEKGSKLMRLRIKDKMNIVNSKWKGMGGGFIPLSLIMA